MKIFTRGNLPQEIKYNNTTYHYLTGSTGKNVIIGYCKANNYKLIQVNVKNRRLNGKTDLYNRPYTPSEFYFCSPKMPHAEVVKLTDLIREGTEFQTEINSY